MIRMTSNALEALQQHATGALEPGEEFVAGLHIQSPSYDRGGKAAVVGGGLGMLMAAGAERKAQSGNAVALTGAGAFIGVTSTRVLVFGVGLMARPGDLLTEARRADITIEVEPFRASGIMKMDRVRLVDGDHTFVEGQCSASKKSAAQIDELRARLSAAT